MNYVGGDLFLGVLDDGTALGAPDKAASEMIQYDEKHTTIHVHIPPSTEVHGCKKVIYDRVDDAEEKVTTTGAIAQMYILFRTGTRIYRRRCI